MEFKKALKAIKKAMIEKEKASQPFSPPSQRVDEEVFDNCLCTDSQNRFKALYSTQAEAERQAKFLYDEQGIFLLVYPCPGSSGWHLTKG